MAHIRTVPARHRGCAIMGILYAARHGTGTTDVQGPNHEQEH